MENGYNLYEKGLEEYPKGTILLNNLIIIIWISLGTIACWFIDPLIAGVYLFFAVLMIYVILRKLICPNCYYYGKWCSTGWGKLSALFFKKGKIAFSKCVGMKLPPLVFGLLILIPLILIIFSSFQEFSLEKILVLILLLIVSIYSMVISRIKTCRNCKMKLICPGSMDKSLD